MIDKKLLLSDFERIRDLLLIKKVEGAKLEKICDLSNDYKKVLIELESAQAAQNKQSKLFFEYKKNGKDINELKNELNDLKNKINKLQEELDSKESALNEFLLNIPNIPDSHTPKGENEDDNVVLKEILEIPSFAFKPKEHWELAEKNKWIGFEVGVKLAKSRFSVLFGEAARLNRALINFMLDFNRKHGFSEVCTPAIVNKDSLLTTGQLPKFEEDMFKIEGFNDEEIKRGEKPKGHELYLISTAEITLTNLYRDTIIPIDELPIKLCAHTPCFRKEAGSAGRDTRGIIRQHQFDKVELVAITHPNNSDLMQEEMLECASGILKELNLPHRFVQLCGGDLGFSASNTVDIEVWLPGQNCYREISSVSNVRDFQARRGKIRFKDDDKKNRLAHTLNGSSLAVGRTLVAIMENYQNEDGSISIPDALKKYMA